MCNNENNQCQCIAEILTVISILQKNANCTDVACLDTCDRGFLGCGTSTLGCNTRPIMLYTCCGNGTPWSMPTTKTDKACNEVDVTCSNVFRVEKIDGFFTMNLNCVCCLRCLNDTFVDSI